MPQDTGGILNLKKPVGSDDIRLQTIGIDLPYNFQKIDDAFTAHQGDTTTDAHLIANITGLQTALNSRPEAGTQEGKALTIYKSTSKETANVTINLGEIPSDSLNMIFMIYASVRQATTQWGEGLWMLYRSLTGTAYVKEVFARDITLNISTGSIVLSHSSANVRCLVGKIIRMG